MLFGSCQEEELNINAGSHLFFSKLSSCPLDAFPKDTVTLQTPNFTPKARPIYHAMAPVHWTAQHSLQPLMTMQNNNGVHPPCIKFTLKLVNAVKDKTTVSLLPHDVVKPQLNLRITCRP
jgi:hypothetical protein